VRSRYYWPGWLCDVKKCVQQYFACSMDKLKRPGIQAKMVKHHPQRRLQIVGIDVMEMSPTSRQGMKKVIVIGDLFSRYVVAVAVADESAKTVAEVLFERWVAIFGPPEALLSDRGRAFYGKVMTELCDRTHIRPRRARSIVRGWGSGSGVRRSCVRSARPEASAALVGALRHQGQALDCLVPASSQTRCSHRTSARKPTQEMGQYHRGGCQSARSRHVAGFSANPPWYRRLENNRG
jgi:Integrase core domain